LVMVVLEFLRQGLDAGQPLDERCRHGLCVQIHLECFLGILQMDIAECGYLYNVENLMALELRLDVKFNGMNCNETHDSPINKQIKKSPWLSIDIKHLLYPIFSPLSHPHLCSLINALKKMTEDDVTSVRAPGKRKTTYPRDHPTDNPKPPERSKAEIQQAAKAKREAEQAKKALAEAEKKKKLSMLRKSVS
jgi:hypothetical protein